MDRIQRPIFTAEQLTHLQLKAESKPPPKRLQATNVLDTESLLADIRTALATDPFCKEFLNKGEPTDDLKWERDVNGYLRYEGRIFVLDSGDLRLKVLKAKHDHILAGHLGQAKTLQLVRREYTWPKLRDFVTNYVNSCNICSQNKPRHHKPYGALKQLPIPPRPWKSVSMDFIE